jgi:predicted ATP-dependent endonuclease of OLD family
MLTVASISVENLRGYTYSKLHFDQLTVLVGENNEGKSSLLKMFEKLMLMPDRFWDADKALTDEDFEFWYPANEAKHRARRFTITVRFLDGRLARAFNVARDSEVMLRLAVGPSDICRLNVGQPRRNETHDPQARELLRKLQQHVKLIFVPPVRDARSSSFTQKLTRAVTQEIEKKIAHNRRAGAPREYRLAREAIEKIQKIVEIHAGGLATSNDSPLASMLRSSEVRVELFPSDIYSLIEKSLFVYLSTGSHDEGKVSPKEVGNGLQSLIDIDLSIEQFLDAQHGSAQENRFVIIEEPEAFLHPSAQRQFMQFLRRALVSKVKAAVLTTHSPIILDEARYEEIVLVRNQKHYAPTATETDRRSINTSLMTNANAEVFFSRTAVLVEGPGDKAFLNTLLRRIRDAVPVSRELTGIVVQETGGCTFYSPWLKLVNSYGQGDDRPLRYLWVMDGDVASAAQSRAVLRTAVECAFGLSDSERDAITRFGDLAWETGDRFVGAVSEPNRILASRGGHLFCCDFEWALFNGSGSAALRSIISTIESLGVNVSGSHVEIARRLGSKIGSGRTQENAKKAPYIRAQIAENLPLNALPPEIYILLQKIFSVALKSEVTARSVFNAASISMDSTPAVPRIRRTSLRHASAA